MDKFINDFDKKIYIVENIIGYNFRHKELLKQAFTHPSLKRYGMDDYDELEFIGDKIAGMLFAKVYEKSYLIQNRKNWRVNSSKEMLQTTNKKAANTLSNYSFRRNIVKKGLDKYMLSCGLIGKKNIADLFESILGAIAIDTNWNISILEKVYKHLLDDEVRGRGMMKRITSARMDK